MMKAYLHVWRFISEFLFPMTSCVRLFRCLSRIGKEQFHSRVPVGLDGCMAGNSAHAGLDKHSGRYSAPFQFGGYEHRPRPAQ